LGRAGRRERGEKERWKMEDGRRKQKKKKKNGARPGVTRGGDPDRLKIQKK
jgi:hypothetical protein